MKHLFTIFILFISINTFGQNRNSQSSITNNSNHYTLYVRFKNNIVNENLQLKKTSKLQHIFELNNISIIENLNINFQKLEKKITSSENKTSLNSLKNIYKIKIRDKSKEDLQRLVKQLESEKDIEYVSLIENTPIAPPFIRNKSTKTPDLESYQSYIESNPGLDFKYAWSIGIAGQNINVLDVEYGFKKSHEMLSNLENVQLEKDTKLNDLLIDSTSAYYNYLDHGTAVSSIMVSSNNKIGLIGSTYKIKEFTCYLEWTEDGYDRVEAVASAISDANKGDIIIYEMQTPGENNNYVTAEYNKVIWDLTKTATDAGIIVIAAAGNGNENLDGDYYKEYMNRGNSGAIIVGAGSNDTTHSRLYFSTYGSRIDLQGWGENVVAAGYGDWVKYNNKSNRTYTLFNGTSSATPLVASAAALIQSYYFEQTGEYLTPKEMKKLLIETAIPQGGDISKNIGPLPNVKAAIEKLKSSLNITDSTKPLEIKIYPNPVKDYLYIQNISNQKLTFDIINFNGVSVSKGSLINKIDLSKLEKGTYIIKITDGNRLQVEKIIKI
ncbi:S8/S53 family peptidase [Chishuiella sp.]|uniref:S8/S53 family peptidase n=1 Tax=Chishuiella sp. TaxID=1969467 RepID=UPI0028A8F292|nr:S8/S53 family peptidase [Chishuiella sp.]